MILHNIHVLHTVQRYFKGKQFFDSSFGRPFDMLTLLHINPPGYNAFNI